jgi:hypothetical protein
MYADATLGLEAVAYQSGRLFIDLTTAMGILRKADTLDTKSIAAAEIPEIVRLHTNMRIGFDVKPTLSMGAYIRLPEIDRNHPFITNAWRGGDMSDDVGVALIRVLGGRMQGSVDTLNCKVSGVYKDIQGDVVFGAGLVNDESFTDAELASVLMHEIGHLFTYFEYLGTLVMTSAVIAGIAKSMYKIDSYDKRLDTLKEADRILGVDTQNRERIAASPNANARSLLAQSVYISTMGTKARSDTGFNIYELRSCEQLADQFVTRHGCGGRDLASALDKMYRKFWSRSAMSTTEYTIWECTKLIMFLAGLFIIPLPLIVFLLVFNPTRKIYDDPAARLTFIRQQMTDALKDKSLDDRRRAQILEDIAAVGVLEANLDDKRTLLQLFWTTLMPSGRAALSQEATQKQVEALLNNELFVAASKFKVGV